MSNTQASSRSLATPYLTVPEVAKILAVSDETVTKQFASLEGVIDIGTPGTLHKRRKRLLRIPQGTLERYISDRQVRVRRR
jgi:hypothetical protein